MVVPLALVRAAAELWLASAILLGRGTSTTEETVVGAAFALAGAAALLAACGLGHTPEAAATPSSSSVVPSPPSGSGRCS